MQGVDKNMLTGLLLMALLFMVYSYFLEPPPPSPNTMKGDSTAVNAPIGNTGNTNPSNGSNVVVNNQAQNNNSGFQVVPGLFKQDSTAQEQFVTLENDKVKLTFSNKGGKLYRAEIKGYVTADSLPLVLIDGNNNQFAYQFFLDKYAVSTEDYFFTIFKQSKEEVVFRLYKDDDAYIEQYYRFAPDGTYMVDYDLKMVGFHANMLDGTKIALKWKHHMQRQEKDVESERYNTGVYYKERDDSPTYLSETSDDQKETSVLEWVGNKQQFFNTSLLADKGFKNGDVSIKKPATDVDPTLEISESKLTLVYERDAQFTFPMHWYIGPNHYQTLKAYDKGLEDMVPLGWGIFGWVNKWFIIPMFNFLDKYIGNYGVIILILTLFIKTLLFPLTRKSYMSFAKMNVLKPDLEALKEKYEKDPQKLQMAQMQLYRNAGVNPLGGCLPQMLQFPILIAMYRFFPSSIELRQQPFLWANDLSTYDSIMSLPFEIPFYGDHVSLFCLLSAASSLIYMKVNQSMTPSAGNNEFAKQMQVMQYIMPVMLLFFFNSFSAGLTFYFFLSNVISFVQQWVIKKFFINEDKIRKEIQANQQKPKEVSSFQGRLEKMMKEQQQAQKRMQEERAQRQGGNRRERRRKK